MQLELAEQQMKEFLDGKKAAEDVLSLFVDTEL